MAAPLPAFAYTATGATEIIINFTVNIAHSDEFNLRAQVRDSFSGSGIMQRQTDFIEDRIILEQRFIPETERDLVETMMRDHVLGGGTFKYIPDQTDLLTFTTVQLVDTRWDGSTRDPITLNLFKWRLNLRKVIT